MEHVSNVSFLLEKQRLEKYFSHQYHSASIGYPVTPYNRRCLYCIIAPKDKLTDQQFKAIVEEEEKNNPSVGGV